MDPLTCMHFVCGTRHVHMHLLCRVDVADSSDVVKPCTPQDPSAKAANRACLRSLTYPSGACLPFWFTAQDELRHVGIRMRCMTCADTQIKQIKTCVHVCALQGWPSCCLQMGGVVAVGQR